MKARIWVSYDLGVRGDYTGLYKWLATKEARECGESVATFMLETEHHVDDEFYNKIWGEVYDDINNHIKLESGNRIYVIVAHQNGFLGKFIYGNRQTAPWDKYKEQEDPGDSF